MFFFLWLKKRCSELRVKFITKWRDSHCLWAKAWTVLMYMLHWWFIEHAICLMFWETGCCLWTIIYTVVLQNSSKEIEILFSFCFFHHVIFITCVISLCHSNINKVLNLWSNWKSNTSICYGQIEFFVPTVGTKRIKSIYNQ